MSVPLPEIPEPTPVELPADRCAVVVVDMQNDFVKPEGRLRVPSAEETVRNISSLLSRARERGVKVIYTQDWHSEDDPEFKIWGEHARAGTWGAEIVEELKPLQGDIVVKKLRYDGFYGTPLDHLLRLRGIEELVVTGTVANICVLHTAGSAALRWINVYLPLDCISALTEFDYYLTQRQVTFLYRGRLTYSGWITFR